MSLWRRIVSERRAVVVPVLTVLAINIAVLALAVFPLQASVSGDESRAGDVKFDLANALRAERIANETQASTVRADEELKTFYSDVLPRSHAAARNLLFVQLRQFSSENNVKFETNTFEPEPVDDSSLVRFRVDTQLTGSYADIRQFLYDIETSGDFYVIEQVKLAESALEPGAGSRLEVVLQIVTYYIGTVR
jgi:Tfp pilus assembly protein PilO